MKLHGPLEEASLEVLSSNPTNSNLARIFFNSTENKAKVAVSTTGGTTFDDLLTASQVSGTSDNRSGTDAIPVDTNFVDVTFSAAMPTADYSATVSMENASDNDPIFFSHIVRDKTVSGFRIILNGNADTANYIANWKVQIDT